MKAKLSAGDFLRRFGCAVLLLAWGVASHAPAIPIGLPTLEKSKSKGIQEGANLLRKNQFDEARALAQRLLAEQPKDAYAHLLLALAEFGGGNEDKAREQALIARPLDPHIACEIFNSMAQFHAVKRQFYRASGLYRESLAVQANDPASRGLANIYLAQGLTAKARESLEKVTPLAEDHLVLSRIYLAERDYAKAEIHAASIVQKEPASPQAEFLLCSCLLLNGKLKPAAACFDRLLASQPKFSPALYNRGLIGLLERDYTGALRDFDAVLANEPGYSGAHLGRAMALYAPGKLPEALAAATSGCAAAPGETLGYLIRASIWLELGRLDDGRADFKQAAADFPDFGADLFPTSAAGATGRPWLHFALAQLYLHDSLAGPAVQEADAAAQASGPHSYFDITKARALVSTGRSEEARSLLAERVKASPKLAGPRVELGNLAIAGGNLPEALKQYEAAALLAKNSVLIHMRLGELYFLAEKSAEAVEAFQRVVALSPSGASGYNQLAWTLAEANRDLETALRHALRAQELDPRDLGVADTLAWVYYKMQRYPEALKVYEQLSKTDTINPSPYHHLGLIYLKLNRSADARGAFESALNMNGDFEPAREQWEKLGTP